MPEFAAATKVEVTKTKSDIEKLLKKYGAGGFITGWHGDREALTFELQGRRYRYEFAVITEETVKYDKNGRERNAGNLTARSLTATVEQAQRTRWRELLLGIKAKLVMVDAGITTLEEEFLSHVVLVNNQTVSQWIHPFLREAYAGGEMPPMIPGVSQKALESGEDEDTP